MTSLTIRRLRSDDLELVLGWRNDPTIRSMMLSSREIALPEHLAWFDKASKSDSKALYIFSLDDVDAGFGQLGWDKQSLVADWGFYASPSAPKGTGTRICAKLLDAAFDELGLAKVGAQVLHFNQKSLALHKRLGFVQEGILRSHHWDGATWQDLYCFGILKNEWPGSAEGLMN